MLELADFFILQASLLFQFLDDVLLLDYLILELGVGLLADSKLLLEILVLILELIDLQLLIGLVSLVGLDPFLKFIDLGFLLVDHILEVEVFLNLLVGHISLLLHLLDRLLFWHLVNDFILLDQILSQLVVLLDKLFVFFLLDGTQVL